ncbi:HNH endonuclease family protein [Neobacillus mesonae]|uniref:hypothetical protein n=1 Tax=Neobacillus mesonae TaxID=1193713 RepID=UPI00082B3461|nr:hypothetical protein [Neobacillus mesonae]
MINVTKGTEPIYLINQNADKNGEKERIIKFIENEKKTWEDLKKVFSFSVYSNDSVKRQLKTDFHSKCAFCEGIFTQNSYGEVEHWRPKKGVTGNSKHKGYYWLASDWNNLLWSCRVCNSTKYKGNHFPLKDINKTCYDSKGKLANEEPLLLNPCDPKVSIENHIEFLHNGIIQGKTIEGDTSIKIYGLKRPDLQAERYKHAIELERSFNQIKVAFQDLIFYLECERQSSLQSFGLNIKQNIKKKKKLIIELINIINERLSIKREFVGMNQQLVRHHVNALAKNKVLYKILKSRINLSLL